MKYKKIISILLICVFMVNTAKSQNVVSKVVTRVVRSSTKSSVNKTVGEQGIKLSAEKIGQIGIKKGSERSVEKAMSKRLASRIIREKMSRMIAKKGFRNMYTYGNRQAAKSLNRIGTPTIIRSSKKRRFAVYANSIRKNSAKTVAKKGAEKNVIRLVVLYCGKGGFKKFMALSIKERMVTIKQLTKYIFSLPEVERNKILSSMSEEMRIKVLKMRKIMTTRMPGKPSPKGRWVGERGNSDFILDDNYMWTDPKTGVKTSVRDLKKKYKIKGEIRVKYRDGEPIFDKSNSLGTTTVEYKQNYNYKDLKDLHNPVNENLSRESWVKTKINKKAVNPTRDYIENAAVDGSRVSGARNTYHESMDGETIYVVPDFIHSICTHNGGRSVAALVQ